MDAELEELLAVMTFEEWLQCVFSADENLRHKPELGAYLHKRTPYAEYTIIAWNDPRKWLVDRFPMEQVGAGLWSIWHPYVDKSLPRELRDRAWEAVRVLFRDLFTPYVSRRMASIGEIDWEKDKLDGACHMWWDASLYAPGDEIEAADVDYFISICEESLFRGHIGTQDAAIHGLGHMVRCEIGREPSQALLSRYLKEVGPRSELAGYARQAMTGKIL